METHKDYILRLYNEARGVGLCHTQGEFAKLLGIDKSTLSGALHGNEKNLTLRLIRRLQAWEKQVLEPKRAPKEEKAPQPDIIIPAATAQLYNNMSATIRIQAELIARLQGGMPMKETASRDTRYRMNYSTKFPGE